MSSWRSCTCAGRAASTSSPSPTTAAASRLGWPAGEARLLACGLIGRLDPRPHPLGELRDIARDYGLRRAGLEGLDRRDLAPTAAAMAFTLRSATGWLRRAR